MNVASSEKKIVFAGKLAGFGVIDHQNIDMLQSFAEFGGRAFNPIVHGIESDEFGLVIDLFNDATLKIGRDIGEKNVRGFAEFRGEFGIKVSEDVQFGDQGFAFVEMLGIFSGPEEGFADGALEASGIDFAAMEDGLVFGGKIFADDGDEVDMSEEAGGYCEISGGSADNPINFAIRAFDGVKCDRAYNE